MSDKLGDNNVTIDKDGTVRVYGSKNQNNQPDQPPKSEFEEQMERSFLANMWEFGKFPIFIAAMCLVAAGIWVSGKNYVAVGAWLVSATAWITVAGAEARIGVMKILNGEILKDNMMMGMHLSMLKTMSTAIKKERENG